MPPFSDPIYPDLMASGRRYRVLQPITGYQDSCVLKVGQEFDLVSAEYSFVPYHGIGGWHLRFKDIVLSLEITDQAEVIEHITDYFQDIGPFDLDAYMAKQPKPIGIGPTPGDSALGDQEREALAQEMSAVLDEFPVTNAASLEKARRLAAARLRAKKAGRDAS